MHQPVSRSPRKGCAYSTVAYMSVWFCHTYDDAALGGRPSRGRGVVVAVVPYTCLLHTLLCKIFQLFYGLF